MSINMILVFVSSPFKWRKISLIKWREISLDMQKQTLLKIQISIFFLFLFFSFVKPYLSPKHRWSLKLAWCTCGTSDFCNNRSRGNCAWFAVLCVTLQSRMPSPPQPYSACRASPRAAGLLFLGSREQDMLGKLRGLLGWVHYRKRTGKVF